jgi:4-amino-4-deoxy-L-arabinose transferase-like glycosyltransferase
MLPRRQSPASSWHRRRRFRLWLLIIAALGVGVRVAYGIASGPRVLFAGDPWWFYSVGSFISDGHGYISPLLFFKGLEVPTAERPPVYPLMIAAVHQLGGTTEETQRLVLGSGFGALLIVGVGLLGRELAGSRAGLIAATLAALAPFVVAADGSGESEAAFGPLLVLALLVAYRLRRSPQLGTAAILGLVIGLCTLTRSDGILLLSLPALVLLRSSFERRWHALAVALLTFALVLAPWVIRNWVDLGRPVLSTNVGTLIAGTNCDETYYGPKIGSFALCFAPPRVDEVAWSNDLVRQGVGYARRHAGRLPAVLGARVLRVWGLWDPTHQFAIYNTPRWVQHASLIAFYPLLLLGLAGIVLLKRRGLRVDLLLVPFAITLLLAVGSWGTTRFRRSVEVVLPVAAAIPLAGGRASASSSRKSKPASHGKDTGEAGS